jgi:hypothetical protein
MLIKVDKANKFVSKFNPKTGLYIRSGIIENGVDTGVDPYMTEYPELIDIGIMGHCLHGLKSLCIKSGVECYQNGQGKVEPNMPLDDYKKLMDESEFRTYQVAIGGRGDPNKHKEFKEILQYSRQRNIVPNYTTSGLDLTDEEAGISAELCGAVAVSWYRTDYTLSAIEKLLKYKCTVNIHYVLANNSIDEAISRLRSLDFPDNIHAVIFLLHKPVGQGSQDNVIKLHDPRLVEFFKVEDEGYVPNDAKKARALAIDTSKRIATGILYRTEEVPNFYERLVPRQGKTTTLTQEVEKLDVTKLMAEFV